VASRPAGSRRAARERALSLLYEAEVKGQTIPEVLGALPVAPDGFVIEIVSGVEESRATIDGLISRFSIDWPLGRMPVVDRNVLRMAVFELTERPATPVAVVIDEAVDLAKLYSTEASGSFVNGLLSAVAASVRPPC
jgi:N utilization substance protein B